jgi:hypothetical protein
VQDRLAAANGPQSGPVDRSARSSIVLDDDVERASAGECFVHRLLQRHLGVGDLLVERQTGDIHLEGTVPGEQLQCELPDLSLLELEIAVCLRRVDAFLQLHAIELEAHVLSDREQEVGEEFVRLGVPNGGGSERRSKLNAKQPMTLTLATKTAKNVHPIARDGVKP